ncbi:MAG: RsiV family protein [Lawsonibacter sp.]
MKKSKQPAKAPEVIWHEEKRTLTLEEEPVLEYILSWPEIQGAGIGGLWISRYYARLAEAWRLRWQREVYWKACIKLSQCRAASRPFIPWTGRLEGAVTLWKDGLLSLRLNGEEVRGDGKPCRVRWGDVWKLREGAPCPLKEFFPGKRRWKKELVTQITELGNRRRTAGECFLDQGWEEKVSKFLPVQDFCLTSDGLEFAFPQCVIAPAAEGNPVFCVPMPGDGEMEKAPA